MADNIDYDELRDLINNLHTFSHKAVVFTKMKAARATILRVHGVSLSGTYDLCSWIAKMRPSVTQIASVSPPAIAPPKPAPRPVVAKMPLVQLQPVDYDPRLLGYMFKEIYESGYDFGDCTNPTMLSSFIHPTDGKWDLRVDQLTGPQRNTVTTISIHYKDWRLAQGYIPGYLIRRTIGLPRRV
jgi:hypothetical protein